MASVAAVADDALDDTSWSRVITVNRTDDANRALAVLFHDVARLGLSEEESAHLLKRIGDSFGPEIALRGKAQLSVGMLADAVTAAKTAKWSAADMARLVIALDGVLDENRPGDETKLHALVARVRGGSQPDEILASGDTLKHLPGR